MFIVLADDHRLFLEGVSQLVTNLFKDAEVVSCLTIDELRETLHKEGSRVDLVSVDLRMPGMNGARTLRELMAAHPGLPFVVLSASENLLDFEACRDAGVLGFIRKSDSVEALESAFRKVITGDRHFPSGVLGTGVHEAMAHTVAQADLSERQYQVLQAIADNLSNQGIADQLNISENTVKTHLKHLYALFKVSSRLECVQKARALGVL